MISKKTYLLAKEIADTMNEINNNKFTEDEIKEGIREYEYMLDNNEKHKILNLLNEEIKSGGNSPELISLSEKVLAF